MTPRATNLLMAFIAAACVLLLGAVIFVLFTKQVPETNRENVAMVLGGLLQNFGMIVGYFFASSRSSQTKDATIDALAARMPAPAGADSVVLKPGETATATATTTGAVIERTE